MFRQYLPEMIEETHPLRPMCNDVGMTQSFLRWRSDADLLTIGDGAEDIFWGNESMAERKLRKQSSTYNSFFAPSFYTFRQSDKLKFLEAIG